MDDSRQSSANETGQQALAEAERAADGPRPAPSSDLQTLAVLAASGVQWCKRCEVYVIPKGKGRCPHCETFLPANTASHRDPQQESRQEATLARLLREYTPQSESERAQCSVLAAVIAKLETARPETQQHERLVRTLNTVSAALNDARQKRADQPPQDLTKTPTQDLRGRLRELLALAGDVQAAEAARAEAAAPAPAAPTSHPGANGAAPGPEPDSADALQAAICPFCYRSAEECVAMKETRIDTWRALHSTREDEVERRRQESTAEMLLMLGQPPRF